MRDLLEFSQEFFRTLISRITGGILAVFLTFGAFYLKHLPPSWILWGSLAIYFFLSAFGVWKKERRLSGRLDFTEGDVQALFQRIPELTAESISAELGKVTKTLIRNGIQSRKQLQELVESRDYLDELRRVYNKCLRRDSGANLDPMAVANYGSLIYLAKGSRESVRDVARRLKIANRNGAR